jgi:hypothetical protein
MHEVISGWMAVKQKSLIKGYSPSFNGPLRPGYLFVLLSGESWDTECWPPVRHLLETCCRPGYLCDSHVSFESQCVGLLFGIFLRRVALLAIQVRDSSIWLFTYFLTWRPCEAVLLSLWPTSEPVLHFITPLFTCNLTNCLHVSI